MKSSVPYNDYGTKLKELVKWPTDSKGKPLDNVVYQSLHKGKLWEWTPDDQRILVDTHPGIMIPNMDTIWDEQMGESIQIAYYKTLKAPTEKNGAVVPALLPIEFKGSDRGFLFVPYKGGQQLYAYLELMNANRDCVNADHVKPDIGYLFERVKPEQVAEQQLDKMAEVFRVGGLVMEMSVDALRKLAPRLGLDGTVEPKALQYSILRRVQEDPASVNDMLDSEQQRIEEEVRKAIGKKLIEFDPNIGGYVVYASRDALCLVPAGTVDKIDALTTYLATESGRGVRDKIRNLLGNKKDGKTVVLPVEDEADDDDEKPAKPKAAAKAAARKPAPAKPARKPAAPAKKREAVAAGEFAPGSTSSTNSPVDLADLDASE